MKATVDVMFTQMSVKKGMSMFGQRAVAAMIKDLTQLDITAMHRKPVVILIDPKLLALENKKKALYAVCLIKGKREGIMKDRTCANGRNQRQCLKFGESVSSPTSSLEGMALTFLIAACEGREVVSFDIPGGFLQAEMVEEKFLLLKFRG